MGKEARGEFDNKGFFDYARKTLWNKSWAYWRYTREISEKVFGNDSIENIAFSNLIKCNDRKSGSNSFDNANKDIKDNCLREERVAFEEVRIIKPNIIVLYTNTYYDEYITGDNCLFDSFEFISSTTKNVGKRKMPWMEGIGHISGLEDIRVLRVGHPQCKKKIAFVDLVSIWIKKEK